MKRPIGVTILATLSFLAGLANLWRVGVYLGWFNFEIAGESMSLPNANWAAALWALLIAAIWFWVALGFWNVRASAWQFGTFISLFTLIWGFFALLFGSTVTAETIPWLLAGAIYVYLMWPGVREAFAQAEMSRLTPEQRAAIEQLQAANAAAGQAPPPGMTPPPTA
jgi:hypothetical protein